MRNLLELVLDRFFSVAFVLLLEFSIDGFQKFVLLDKVLGEVLMGRRASATFFLLIDLIDRRHLDRLRVVLCLDFA
jgi:hypothetical protein